MVDDFGKHGRTSGETNVQETDLETIIMGMLEGFLDRHEHRDRARS
jgi:hypothetical protein